MAGRCALVLAGLLALAGVRAAERVALVIGNSAYQHTAVLLNPVNDANDIAVALAEAANQWRFA